METLWITILNKKVFTIKKFHVMSLPPDADNVQSPKKEWKWEKEWKIYNNLGNYVVKFVIADDAYCVWSFLFSCAHPTYVISIRISSQKNATWIIFL